MSTTTLHRPAPRTLARRGVRTVRRERQHRAPSSLAPLVGIFAGVLAVVAAVALSLPFGAVGAVIPFLVMVFAVVGLVHVTVHMLDDNEHER